MSYNKLSNRTGQFLLIFMIFMVVISCKENTPNKQDVNADLSAVISEMQNDMQTTAPHSHSHDQGQAIVKEILNTDRYSYLFVSDPNNHEFWVAIPKEDISVGDKISYEGGLLKRNFESKEFNRNFETLYLVSRYNIERNDAMADQNKNGSPSEDNSSKKIIKAGKGNDLGTLFSDPQKWSGKEYTITGTVSKVNFNIMGTNWVHIGDKNHPGLELTITTSSLVNVGDNVSFTGTITLNKDFGAGYKYDVIMENARLKK